MPNYLSSNGTPADNTGVTGDFSLDYLNKFLWGPKPTDTSWAGSAKSIVGPAGPTGPGGYVGQLSNQAKSFGTAASWNAYASDATYKPLYFPGTTLEHSFTPNQDSALTNAQVVNFGATGANAFPQLVNLTTGQVVVNFGAIASGSISQFDYNNTANILKAGNRYQWQCTRGTAGNITVYVVPTYLVAAAQSTSLSYFPNMVIASSQTAASAGNVVFFASGIPGQQQYFRQGTPAYLYTATIRATGTGPVAFYISNDTSGTTLNIAQVATTLSSTVQEINFGPFKPGDYPFATGAIHSFRLYASGGAINVTQANLVIQVGLG